jgi:hypothetical protein
MSQSPFDAVTAVERYRRIIERRDAAATCVDRDNLDSMATHLRAEWQQWQGEDSLHQAAFGKPA